MLSEGHVNSILRTFVHYITLYWTAIMKWSYLPLWTVNGWQKSAKISTREKMLNNISSHVIASKTVTEIIQLRLFLFFSFLSSFCSPSFKYSNTTFRGRSPGTCLSIPSWFCQKTASNKVIVFASIVFFLMFLHAEI